MAVSTYQLSDSHVVLTIYFILSLAVSALALLGAAYNHVVEASRNYSDGVHAHQFIDLYTPMRRIWHEALREIRATDAPTPEQRALKDKCINSWLDYGSVFGLQERTQASVTEVPSTPSNDVRYWRVPRRCYSNACACSVIQPHMHAMRVCKGCRCVMYCSAKCQAA